jgi:hypothetical protein
MMRSFLKCAGAVVVAAVCGGVAWGQTVISISPPALPGGEVSVPYPGGQQFTASDSDGTATCCTWSASGLSNGLSLDASGTLSGTPTAPGPITFTVTATDSNSASQDAGPFTVTIIAPGISPSTLPAGEEHALYGQTLTGTGGAGPPYTLSQTGGSLPSGLTFTPGATATIGGTPGPGTAGSYPITVTVTDSAGGTASQPYTILINPPPSVSTSSLPPGEATAVYNPPSGVSLLATGGSPPYTWSLDPSSPPLPGGLALSPAGLLSGTPSAATTLTLVVKVTDLAGVSATQTLPLTINAAPVVAAASLPNGDVNAVYPTQTLSATGGTPGYTWSISSGSLPAGMTLSAGGQISGTPTASGTFNFTAKATDSIGGFGTQSFSLTINAAPTISPAGGALTSGEVGASYSQPLSASGGSGGNTWTVASGVLPGGLTLAGSGSTATISGTPTASGPFTFSIKVTDSLGGSDTQSFSINIVPGPTISTAPTLPNGTVGAPYTASLSAVDGTSPYSWSITVGSLPAGLTLAGSTGTISGIPTSGGTANFTVQVSDAKSVTATKAFTITIASGLTIATAPVLPGGAAGTAYSQTLSAVGGTAPYTWTITAGSLPAGLSLNAATGAISGTPTGSGTSNFTVQVTDNSSVKASKAFTLNITSSLVITTAGTLPGGSVSVPYSVTLAASGGTAPYRWTIVSGTLPLGINLSSSTGILSGVPQSVGAFGFTVKVSDSASLVATQAFTITIASSLAITTPPLLPGASVGVAYSMSLTAVGGTNPYQWLVNAGSLPAGMALNPVSGLLSGTPSNSGTFTFTVLVTDNAGNRATQQFTLIVGSGLAIITGAVLPPAAIQQPYSLTLNAAGGRPPYTWTASSMPPGLTLSPDGSITGTPIIAGTYHFTVQVTDKNSANVSQAMTLTVAATLTITTPQTLPVGTVGTLYSQTLAASGGQAPYTWSISGGTLPAGVTLSATTGVLSGTPTIGGNFSVNVQVVDNARLTGSQTFSLAIGVPAPPKATVTGVPATATAAQQITFGVHLASGYAFPIQGTATISFEPDAVMPADDQTIQFATGGRTASFTIPANATQSSSIALQTGSVSGTITLTFALQAVGVDLDASSLSQTIKIARAAPAIQSVNVTRTASGFTIQVQGLSTPRELTEVNLHFTQASGANLQTTDLAESLTAVTKQWYQGQASAQFGSQFILVLPITASQGSATAVSGVSVVLKNSTGDSQKVSATF